ncbi:MAG: glycoside hydrolase family 10 protein, partial [Nostoc sp.]
MIKRFVKLCVEFPSWWYIRQSKKSLLFAVIVTLSVVATVILSLPLNAQINLPRRAVSELRGVWLTNIDSDVLFERARLKG